MTKHLMIAAFSMLALSACSSSATLVRKDQAGGRIALQGAYMPAMGDARMLMVEHCGGRFEARELGDSVEFQCRGAQPSDAVHVEVAAASRQEPVRPL